MKGPESHGEGKKAPKNWEDWWQRGSEIPKEDVPPAVMAVFKDKMDEIAKKKAIGVHGLDGLINSGRASATFRIQSLGRGVHDYIMHVWTYYENPATRKKDAWIISVEVRNDIIGQAVTRFPATADERL